MRKGFPLHFKMESLLEIMYRSSPNEIKQEFQFPKKSIFDLSTCVWKSPRIVNRLVVTPKMSPRKSEEKIFEEFVNNLQLKEEKTVNLTVEKGMNDPSFLRKKIQVKKTLKNLMIPEI